MVILTYTDPKGQKSCQVQQDQSLEWDCRMLYPDCTERHSLSCQSIRPTLLGTAQLLSKTAVEGSQCCTA